MKKIVFMVAVAALALNVSAKTALVVIAHGSPSPQWNAPVLSLEKKLHEMDIPGISYKRVALMEFAQPDIASVVRDCEQQGCDTIFALPLFIAASGHSEDDIPNILGLKYAPAVHEALVEEGVEFVRSKAHIVVGPTLMNSGVIEKAMLERVKKMSKNPKEEALVLLAYGDEERTGFWNGIVQRTGDYIKKEMDFGYVDSELVAMGQNFVRDVTPLLEKAKTAKKKVLVQGIYLMSSVSSMAKATQIDQMPASEGVTYSEYGIMPKSINDICHWIADTTKGWMTSVKAR